MASPIRDRKLTQWALAYLVASIAVLESAAIVADNYSWPPAVMRVLIAVVIAGFPVALVVAWYHGEKGRQRIGRGEALLLGVIIVVGGIAVAAVARPDDGDAWSPPDAATDLEAGSLAVLPFVRAEGVPGGLDEDLRLRDAFARWEGVDPVEPTRVRRALSRSGSRREDRSVAQELRVERYVRGNLERVGDSLRISGFLHETATGLALNEAVLRVPAGGAFPDSVASRLADLLLFGDLMEVDPTGPVGAEEGGTRSYSARRAFLEGLRALSRWQLDRADSLLGEASRIDPGYGRAHLWRAQALHQAGRAPADLVPLLERARRDLPAAPDRENGLLTALLQLGQHEYPEACASYAELRDRDPMDFIAWHGLGECRLQDPVVVVDADAPTGWSLRGSYRSAVEAYRRAFELLPSQHETLAGSAHRRLEDVLYVRAWRGRPVRSLEPRPRRLVARLALADDTLAFVPYPVDSFMSGTPRTLTSHFLAVERQRRLLRDIVTGWVAAFPANAHALEAMAFAMELTGEPAALDTLNSARRLAGDEAHRRRLAQEAVTLLVKFGVPDGSTLDRGRALADSLLESAHPNEDPHALALLAAMTGRVHRSAELTQRGASAMTVPIEIPAAVVGTADRLLAYAAMGGPADSIAAHETRVDAAIRNRVAVEDQALAREILLARAASLAFPVRPLEQLHELAAVSAVPSLRAQSALARGDSAAARAILEETRARRQHLRPVDLSLDALYPEAWLWARIGDTDRAAALLDATLESLRWLEPGSLGEVAQIGALVRAMMLRADLAAESGDTLEAERWSRAVATLWADADPELLTPVRRLARRD
jgi:tetratricopeptide (TPR) repeat protein